MLIQVSGKKLAFLILMGCLALAALSAETFVFTRLDHDCAGVDCPVCLQIETAQNLLKGAGLAFVAASLADITLRANCMVKKPEFFIRGVTQVALRIKSNT
jgi:hypothetical protein